MTLSIIVAVSENGVIGNKNQLIWHLPNDLKNFKRLTTRHPIIMGRKTFESIGKPLPNRKSIVVSRNAAIYDRPSDDCEVVNSLQKAIEIAEQTGTDEAFIIGGAEIYRLALPMVDKIYLTEIHATFEGDAFFEIPDKNNWKEINRTHQPTDEKHLYSFDVVELVRD